MDYEKLLASGEGSTVLSGQARLKLVHELATDLSVHFRQVDKDRDGTLSPLEIVTASENPNVEERLRDACAYFDLTRSRAYLSERSLDEFRGLTSTAHDAKAQFLRPADRTGMIGLVLMSSIGEGVVLYNAIGCRSPKLALLGTVAVGLISGGTYLLSRWSHSSNFDSTRLRISEDTSADGVLRKYLNK